jgi:outer membrane protein
MMLTLRSSCLKLSIAAILLLVAFAGNGQHHTQQKIGYADWDYIFGAMPEFKQIDTQLQAHGDQLQSQIVEKTKEIEDKLTAYQALPATTDELIRADKQGELQRLDEALQQFREDARRSYELKRDQLMDPVFSKVGTAIEEIAKEHGYSFILNPRFMSGGDILLYTDAKFDISDLVLKKMGVTPPAKEPAVQK